MDHLEFIRLLLEHDADPNARAKDNTLTRTIFTMQWFYEAGATPFIRAAQSSDTALMQLLLDYGADPFASTDNGDTALTACGGIGWVEGVTYERSPKENFEAMRMLLDLGLDPNAANREGRTALMGAALKGRNDVVQMLVDRGARLDTRDGGSRDTDTIVSAISGHTWQALDYADGLVRPGVQSAVAAARDRGAAAQADDRPRPAGAAAQPRRRIDLRRRALPGTRSQKRQIEIERKRRLGLCAPQRRAWRLSSSCCCRFPCSHKRRVTGTVRDASGAVLPGVTVEASSPALIEKTRTAVTDGSGQYRIVDLRPGTYSLTFTLPGFNTVKRDSIELTGSQVSPFRSRCGSARIEETITVTGESPVVDVQTARREIVMQDDVIQTLPVARAAGALLNATPGLDGRQQRRGAVADDDLLQRELEHDQFDLGGRRRPHDHQRLYRCGRAQRRRLVVRLRHAQRGRSRAWSSAAASVKATSAAR